MVEMDGCEFGLERSGRRKREKERYLDNRRRHRVYGVGLLPRL